MDNMMMQKAGPGKSWQWHWMPAAVLLIGVFSIVLLITGNRIHVKEQSNSDLVAALMDIQINTAIAHLWLEEAVEGDTTVDVEKILAHLDQAVRLSEVTLRGGKSEREWISRPLTDPEQRGRADAIKSLLMKFKMIAQVRLQDFEKARISSVLDQQFDAVFKEILLKARALEDIIEIEEARNREKSQRLFLIILVAWTCIVIAVTSCLRGLVTQRKNAEEELLGINEQLLSQTEELRGHREHLTELVGMRTAELTNTITRLDDEISERRRNEEALQEKEKQVRQLSSRLLSAQEVERKRISMELHDALGQILNGMKLQIRIIERGLRDDQKETRRDCEMLLQNMDQVIEEVRRLSLALSPTVLEDLGLTSALQWLIVGFNKNPDVNVKTDISEIDLLIPRHKWIVVYRVIQEVLSNIEKHAHAKNVSVVIRQQGEKVAFSLEDDGKGFDLKQAEMKDTPERGLGLTTMNERVRMLGGVFDLCSLEGKGTLITFSIPNEQGES